MGWSRRRRQNGLPGAITPRPCLLIAPARFTVDFTILIAGCLVSLSDLRPYLPCLLAAIVAAALPAAVLPAAHAQSLPEAPYAAPTADPGSAPHFSIDPKILYQAASAAPAPDGVNVTELCEDESYSFDDAGHLVHVGHVIYKVLTQRGAEGWDSLAIGWEPWHEARPIIRARVIAPDFTVHILDPNTITEAPARGGDYKIYSDGKRLRAPLAGDCARRGGRRGIHRRRKRSRSSQPAAWDVSSLARKTFP